MPFAIVVEDEEGVPMVVHPNGSSEPFLRTDLKTDAQAAPDECKTSDCVRTCYWIFVGIKSITMATITGD